MPLYFAITLFVSAALLFLVQPLFARLVLPALGGSPAVWNTCLVFFQAALLAGYGYAHAAPARLGVRRHALLHLAVLLLPLPLLPIALAKEWAPAATAHPVLALLGLLAVTVGPPFFVVATSGPLLQRWFAATGHRGAGDPYFLYAASNLGSMLALVAYPTLVEPTLPLAEQGRLWAGGYLALVALTAGCAALVWRAPQPKTVAPATTAGPGPTPISSHPALTRLHWVALAFVPSSLLLSVTTYLTTDLAPIPLLWVVPLAIYLLTFVLAFARKPPLRHAALARWLPLVVLLVVLVLLGELVQPVWATLPLHLLGLFMVAMVCHGELARRRPPAEHLTEFYLWLSVGGALGGAFSALVAPLIFPGLAEYPLVLVLACLLRPAPPAAARPAGPQLRFNLGGVPVAVPRKDLLLPLALGAATAALVLAVQSFRIESSRLNLGLMFGVPAVVCYTFLDSPLRFGLGVGALLAAGGLAHGDYGRVEYRERSFFGVHRVTRDDGGQFRQLVHGHTLHGRQSLQPGRRREPLSYYARSGPIGQVFAARDQEVAAAAATAGLALGPWAAEAACARAYSGHVAVVGLGCGALAAYARPGEHWTFYEIDPAVVRIACDKDKDLFFYWKDCRAEHKEVVLGDGRVTLARAPEGRYRLLILDAFSSDAIPAHLLTREALDLYAARLTADGVLAFHISNHYLDLEPVLADQAGARGWACYAQEDREISESDRAAGKDPSHWVLLAARKEDLGTLAASARWRPVAPRPGVKVWSDDFYNLLGAFRFKE